MIPHTKITRRGHEIIKFEHNGLNIVIDPEIRRVTVYDGITHSTAYCAKDDTFDPVVGLSVALLRHSLKFKRDWKKFKTDLSDMIEKESMNMEYKGKKICYVCKDGNECKNNNDPNGTCGDFEVHQEVFEI